VNECGGYCTAAGLQIAKLCYDTLLSHGVAAKLASEARIVTPALDRIVEANTLLSGLGFESGGLAAAHAFAQAFTGIPQTHDDYLHGEMVAMGTLAHLMMESCPDEATRVAEFFAAVGLPIHLGQLGLDAGDTRALDVVGDVATGFPFLANMPMPVTAALVRSAILDAHRLGLRVAEQAGDAAYRRLQRA
jgi:glycerol dehydrogenase